MIVKTGQGPLAWKESSDVGTVRGGVSPTVRDRGMCSWPNVHSPAPPSPTACTERVRGFIHRLQPDTLTLQHKVDFMHEKDRNIHKLQELYCMNE